MVERIRFWLFKAGTWLAYMACKPLPIPFDRAGTRYYRFMTWLWGWAYVGDFDLETWRAFRDTRLSTQGEASRG